MRRIYFICLILLSFVNVQKGFAQTDTINVDFGSAGYSTPGAWNNLTDAGGAGQIDQLVNALNQVTTISLMVFDRFNGINETGTTSPDASLGFPVTATHDSYYGNIVEFAGGVEPTGGIKLTGLNTGKQYHFEVFASRTGVSDNRETKYKFIGNTVDSVYLNVANNTGNKALMIMTPATDGTIDIIASPGENNTNEPYRFYYLGAIKIIYPNDGTQTPVISLQSPNGGEYWTTNSVEEIKWISAYLTEDISIDYSTDNGSQWQNIAIVGPGLNSYEWTIPNTISTQCLVRVMSGALSDQSSSAFTIQDAPCSGTIVVLGSSTAAGVGPSSPDSAWVKRYSAALQTINSEIEVINLAQGGYTTFQILPTGTTIPSGVNETIDANRNITKALTYNPYAIIVNMPSNDALKYYSVSTQLNNYQTLVDYANERGVKVWIATSQPRNFSNPVQIQIQKDLKDTIPAIYGDYSIDFWSGIASDNGFIMSQYNSGDGVHLNNSGHLVLFNRVIEKQIDTLACSPDGIAVCKRANNHLIGYPNPFIDQTTIQVKTISAGRIDIRYIDMTGRQLFAVNKSVTEAGTHKIKITNNDLKMDGNMILAVVTISDKSGINSYSIKLFKMNEK